ncbi:MAG: pyridoxine 5'-phosphate synthase [Xanthomonadales bacterium]|nr:Pyridoxine 5'-phosphate synthase [Xanthomonadales bacterium]MCC6592554.1 pyridoxine 5'-phosphate synthase [Xanthomonadales bacterium]MCE7931377.1 pyridoxine 5'-phosphate synthase [Xanthomonadales bacterium PRO6]
MVQSACTPAHTALSVNLNKVALLRNSRGGALPDLLQAARVAILAGARGITLHPRPDLRHARPDDARAMRMLCGAGVELNLEGNPFATASRGYPGFIDLVLECRPEQATLVPDGDTQLTSDHGFDLRADGARLRPLVARLREAGIRVSLFMDADSPDIERAADIGADRVELYTGPYARAALTGDARTALADCARAAECAAAAGLGVNAGHDLDQCNLVPLLRAVPSILEVSIGHALIGEALYAGLDPTVRAYLKAIASARR